MLPTEEDGFCEHGVYIGIPPDIRGCRRCLNIHLERLIDNLCKALEPLGWKLLCPLPKDKDE